MDNLIEKLYNHYIENANAYINNISIYDPYTNEKRGADEKFMKRIEDIVSHGTRCDGANFREMILSRQEGDIWIEVLKEACNICLLQDTLTGISKRDKILGEIDSLRKMQNLTSDKYPAVGIIPMGRN